MTFTAFNINAQTLKVAILDFENISGILKYDGLGKAMSSMLITDIEANVSPKRLQLVERAQIQKILKEQNFQKTSSVDKATTVKTGKILGVKYLLVGDIYILNDALIINARLIDAESGDIKFSKKQEGKVAAWLMLKTIIAKELAASISMPFTEPNIPDKEMNVATITTFGNAVAAKDDGKLEKAEELLNTVQEFSPDFKYLDDLKSQLDELKKQVQKNTEDIQKLEKSGGLVINAKTYDELWNNIISPLTKDNESVEYLEAIIDNFPNEAISNNNLFGYPLIWGQVNFFKYIENENYIVDDLNRMINHIKKSKQKKVACLIYLQRINSIEHFNNSYSIKSDYYPLLKYSKWKLDSVQNKKNELTNLIEKYNQ